LEQRKVMWAALCLVAATFIKLYGAIGFCLFLFYPDKLKFLGVCIIVDCTDSSNAFVCYSVWYPCLAVS
jgi:hypothetical protein